ncbi:MAG TPA: hypothetical protein VHP11_04710 [Tepidisphaeraceae bacterium]|nr:hypothetical protein [Tepidisphaeraceae bacterium]
MVLSLAIFAILSLAAAITSKDFLEADGIVHYLYARFAFQEPHLFVNVWGRPFCTGVYAVPAAVAGLLGVRATSLVLALLSAGVTYRIAKGQEYCWPVLALIFMLAQPLVFLHSFSELTELPFVLLVALAFWAYQERQWMALAVLVGMMPTARPEGFGFIALAAVALLLHRRARWIPILAVPLAIWSAAGWALCGQPQPWLPRMIRWIPEHWPYASTSVYPPGPLYHFVVMLPAIVSPLVFPAVLVGVWRSFQGWAGAQAIFKVDHRTRCQWLIAVIPLLILVGHSVLYWLGRMASSGELRYMLVVAPFWALLAAKGWEWAFERCQWRRPILWAGVAALLPILANVAYQVAPLKMGIQTKRAQAVARWYESSELRQRYPRLAASHPGVFYYADVSLSDKEKTVEWNLETILSAPAGTVLVWDPMYGVFNADSSRTVGIPDILSKGWVLAKTLKEESRSSGSGPIARMADKIQKDEAGKWYIFLSPQDSQGRATPSMGEGEGE